MNDPPVTLDHPSPPPAGDSARPPRPMRWSQAGNVLLSAIRVAYVRLRFLLLLAVLAVVIGRWDDFRAWTDDGLDRLLGSAVAPKTISPDTEFFCPMCPGVVTRWPEKCPVCKMPLVRRKKGDSAILPNGVIARMQLTPYRVQLAGVRTAPVTYRSLATEVRSVGRINDSQGGLRSAVVQVSSLDAPFVRVGHQARIGVAGGESTRFWVATVTKIHNGPLVAGPNTEANAAEGTVPERKNPESADPERADPDGRVGEARWVTLEAADEQPWPTPNTACVATIAAPLAEREPFASIPHSAPPLSAQELRTVYRCSDHTEYLFLTAGKCPFDENDLEPDSLADDERVEWWCPAHSAVTAKTAGESCAPCDGLALVPRVVTYRPAGKVLAVPDTAVVEAGSLPIVFVETGPGMFDGRVVEVGPASEGFLSVARGLANGERVVVTGAFLLDAETRLNPAVASAYFGATTGSEGSAATPATAVARADTAINGLDRFSLTPRDRAMASQQRTCPVTHLPLGSMGAPIPVVLPDRTFYLCCEGCRAQLPKRTQTAAEPRHTP